MEKAQLTEVNKIKVRCEIFVLLVLYVGGLTGQIFHILLLHKMYVSLFLCFFVRKLFLDHQDLSNQIWNTGASYASEGSYLYQV